MSETGAQSVTRLLEAWNAHDVERAAAFYTPDYKYEDVGQARSDQGPGAVIGHDCVVRVIESLGKQHLGQFVAACRELILDFTLWSQYFFFKTVQLPGEQYEVSDFSPIYIFTIHLYQSLDIDTLPIMILTSSAADQV